MKILNFGSINIDHVYRMDHFLKPGETLRADSYRIFPGGKGFNQSVALAKAGADVFHAGKVGPEGKWLVERLRTCGVDTSCVIAGEKPGGHAVIQVTPDGENAIFIFGGANEDIDGDMITRTLSSFSSDDFLLIQNEISNVADIINTAFENGLKVIFNPAPMTQEIVSAYPLDRIEMFIINEIEGSEMTGRSDPNLILKDMRNAYPHAKIVLTLGEKGVIYGDDAIEIHMPALKVSAVDTTAAGDTFIGFFIGALLGEKEVERALKEACCAAAICTTRQGAADSIPDYAEILPFLTK